MTEVDRRQTHEESLRQDAIEVAFDGQAPALDTGLYEFEEAVERYAGPRIELARRLDAAIREGSPSLRGRREI